MTTLSAMNMKRYFGVVHPFFHRDKVTGNRLLVYVILDSSLVVILLFLSFAFKGILRFLEWLLFFFIFHRCHSFTKKFMLQVSHLQEQFMRNLHRQSEKRNDKF